METELIHELRAEFVRDGAKWDTAIRLLYVCLAAAFGFGLWVGSMQLTLSNQAQKIAEISAELAIRGQWMTDQKVLNGKLTVTLDALVKGQQDLATKIDALQREK